MPFSFIHFDVPSARPQFHFCILINVLTFSVDHMFMDEYGNE